ncbi:MAG: hypothetical protein KIT80_23415 [Chitinophagaceae bacterium]|nr:hypothetical protein [Nitrosomonas sp.]MCW5929889.1 hypothetical protein [Chitinophagaceae bacterium]
MTNSHTDEAYRHGGTVDFWEIGMTTIYVYNDMELFYYNHGYGNYAPEAIDRITCETIRECEIAFQEKYGYKNFRYTLDEIQI